jgi:xyloglucan-specific exo-beta-1,4-glucanase
MRYARILLAMAAALVLGIGMTGLTGLAAAHTSQPYAWRNVEIVGGGFVPGIIFNQSEPGLIYARTDIGGAYRWDEVAQRWVALLDWVGWDQWGWTGIVSLASDPVEPNRVYAAAGTYTNAWDPNNGAILRSSDRGASWEVSPLPFKLGGNMPGRGMGERLAIDPNDNRILYLGAPSGNGLWRSADYGATWARVTSFPAVGTYRDGTGDLADMQGVVWVTFDGRTGPVGGATQAIYVGVAEIGGPSVYRSIDGGATWAALPGQPIGFLPHKGLIDPVNDYLFIATSDNGGPYGGGHGDVWRYSIAAGTWAQISPVPSSDTGNNFFGYSGLTIDRQNPGTIMVTSYSSWWPDTIIWRSRDSGATWTRSWDWAAYPERSFRYTMDISAAPWLDWGGWPDGSAEIETRPKLGWMTESLEIDPFNSERMMYGTGATIYGSENLGAWDQGGQITIKVMAQGLEETAIQELVSPPSGPQLWSGMYDIYGFTHWDVDQVPAAFYSPQFATVSIDYAELKPAIVWRAGDGDAASGLASAAYSTDSGATWTPVASEPPGTTNGGTIAVNTRGGRVVWAPTGAAGVYHSVDNGATWKPSAGLPAEARVVADRLSANTFYAFKDGTFYVSRNSGVTFRATAAAGLPPTARFKAMPGRQGDLWLAGGSAEDGIYGLWHSTNGGASFTRLANVEEADSIGFGKAAPGRRTMALYTSAKINGVRGIYRSDDAGRTWLRINDDLHQYGWTGQTITGDPRIYGRVYIGTNGRGIIYGDISR